MNKYCLILSSLLLSTLVQAADLSPQEQQALQGLRTMFSKQMGRAPTPEEEKQMMDNWRSTVMRVNGMAMQMQMAPGVGVQVNVPAQSAPAAAPPQTISENELLQAMDALGGGGKAAIESGRDGLRINGVNYLDPEGRLRTFAFDVLTGDITYTIKRGDQTVFKYLRAGGQNQPITLATAWRDGNGYQVQTATGKQLAGDVVYPLARGLLVARTGSAFRYEAGQPVKSTAIPDGWVMASFQRGNVGSTEFLMLERDDQGNQSPGGSLFGKIAALGASLGMGRKEDYALMNLSTGKLVMLNIQMDGKTTSFYSNCHRKNSFVNSCDTMNSYDSLFTQNGGRNFGHYYWKAYWYSTPAGPVAATMENGMSGVFITDLTNGKKVEAFSRALGLSSFDAEQRPDGTVVVKANWLFQDHTIDDAIKFLNEHPDVSQPAAQAETKPVAAQGS